MNKLCPETFHKLIPSFAVKSVDASQNMRLSLQFAMALFKMLIMVKSRNLRGF